MLIKARVDFKKPNLKALKRKKFTVADMHVHSRYSDGVNKIKRIMNRAKKLGIGIAITDHNEIRGSIEAHKSRKVFVIPGIETSSSEGIHALFYFYTIKELKNFYNSIVLPNKVKRDFFLRISLRDIVKASSKFKCIMAIAHPYAPGWTAMFNKIHSKIVNKNLINCFHAVEVLSACNLRKRNLRALDLAERIKKPITAGSDAHTLMEIGKAVTYVKKEQGLNGFLNSILNNTNFVVGKERRFLPNAASQTLKVRKHLRKPYVLLKRGVRYFRAISRR
ncbi:MAG: PHP domain-containing protein [Candidatus Woesearchaeota archaeon]|nr:PHP domain-containing protein [Candidatus Woesearchaeota archaeon]